MVWNQHACLRTYSAMADTCIAPPVTWWWGRQDKTNNRIIAAKTERLWLYFEVSNILSSTCSGEHCNNYTRSIMLPCCLSIVVLVLIDVAVVRGHHIMKKVFAPPPIWPSDHLSFGTVQSPLRRRLEEKPENDQSIHSRCEIDVCTLDLHGISADDVDAQWIQFLRLLRYADVPNLLKMHIL